MSEKTPNAKPFITLSQAAKAAILQRMQHCLGHYSAAADHLNAMIADLRKLPDAALAEFANDLGPELVEQIASLHLAHGTAINSLGKSAADLLRGCGVPSTPSVVDVRPLAAKLAEQFRELVHDGERFQVRQLPRPPATDEPPQPTEPTP
jgi:hypothetical protein